MELHRYLSILRRRILLVILTVLLAAGGAYTGTPRHRLYATQATLYVGFRVLTPGGTQAGNPLSNDTMTAVQQVIKTFSIMIRSETVAAAALAETPGLNYTPAQVVGETSAVPLQDTTLLVVEVIDANPRVAATLANAMSDAFVAAIKRVDPGQPGPGTVPNLPAYVFQRAIVPSTPLPTQVRRNVILGGLFGLVAAFAVALLLEYLDLTVKGPDDAERRLGLPVLGVVPLASRAAVAVRAPAAPFDGPAEMMVTAARG